jgi:hypothetical protein
MTYTYSYSGADCKAYAWFEGTDKIYEEASKRKKTKTIEYFETVTRYEKRYPNMEEPIKPAPPTEPLDPGELGKDPPVLKALNYLPNNDELNNISNTILNKIDEILNLPSDPNNDGSLSQAQKEQIEDLISLTLSSFKPDYIKNTYFSEVDGLADDTELNDYVNIIDQFLNLLIAARESLGPEGKDFVDQSKSLLEGDIRSFLFESANDLILVYNLDMQLLYDAEVIAYNILLANHLANLEKYKIDKEKYDSDIKVYDYKLKVYKTQYGKFMEMKEIKEEKLIKSDIVDESYKDEILFKWLNSPVRLSSLATISVSIHDAKAPVRRLGHVGVSGFTKAIRTIAGTMVFLIIEDHPLRSLIAKDPSNIDLNYYYYSLDQEKGRGSLTGKINTSFFGTSKLSSLISKFNLMLRYQTEVYNEKENNFGGASMIIKGIEITGESIVTSVNDMVTEVVIQFVAEDVAMFRASKTDTEETIKEAYTISSGAENIVERINVGNVEEEINVGKRRGLTDYLFGESK